MILWSDSARRSALEPESNPEIEVKHLHHKDMSNYVFIPHSPIDTNNSFHDYKVFNLIKIHESLE